MTTDAQISNATLIRLIRWADEHNSHYVASALRELQERRKADSEPVLVASDIELSDDWKQERGGTIQVLYKGAELLNRSGLELIRDGASFATDLESACMAEALLAQPVLVVTEALQNLRTVVADPRRLPRRKEWIGGQQYSYVLLEEVEALVEDVCRAAMLNGGKL